jgi:hypothetical protein
VIDPPKPKADVCVPAPPKADLAVFIEFTDVQLVPLYSSVTPVTGGIVPPKPKAAV